MKKPLFALLFVSVSICAGGPKEVRTMKRNLYQALWIIVLALCLSSFDLIVAQTQSSTSASAEAKRSSLTHSVQLQLIVASNIANAKTNYPATLEPVVKQLKSTLQFKNHYLVATYLYNVADGSSLEVSDVTYATFEQSGGLSPTFFNLGISGIRLNTNSESTRLSRFRFEARKRIFIQNAQVEGSTPKPVFETIATGITTDLNVGEGVPTIVGTITSALSDGVLVLVITVRRSGAD